jgi:hypothetical protein
VSVLSLLPDNCHATGKTTADTFTRDGPAIGYAEIIELSELTAAAGWLVNDTLVLKIDLTVEREDRFQLDTGAFF